MVFLVLRIHRIYISLMMTTLQITKGISSNVIDEPDLHYIFWDLDNCRLEVAKEQLRAVQEKYGLADIFIVSDKPNSYRAFCFSKRSFKEYLEILLQTKYVDWAFISWTMRRKKAILRTIPKANRGQQEIVLILGGYEPYVIPDRVMREIYETGYTQLPKAIRNYKV